MKRRLLFALGVALLAVISARAAAQSEPVMKARPTADSPKTDERSAVITPANPGVPDFRLTQSPNAGTRSHRLQGPILRTLPAGRGMCYAMRSYIVARDAPGSDATHIAKYTTCTPASAFQVKRAPFVRNRPVGDSRQ
jgi:hypothetical protein